MKGAFRSAFIITAFTFASQFVLFISQIIVAALFGSSYEMDAFLAANTLPQYVIIVLIGSLGFLFVPVYIDCKMLGDEKQAHQLAVSIFNNCLLVLGVITVFGIVFAEPLLKLSAPGLSNKSLEIGVKVAIITWPTLLATGAFNILTSIFQAEKKFVWPAAVPLIGAIINLVLLLALGQIMDVVCLAIAATASVIIQVVLLLKIFSSRKYFFALNWKNENVQRIFKLALPLILVAFLTKFTPLIERFLASGLNEGSISHLNYAFKIAVGFTMLISIGGSTVIFPKMASEASNNDLDGLRATISLGLRIMWLIIAPVVTIGFSLSLPMVSVIFERGEFTAADSIVVADIFKIYLVALMPMCLGNITGKGFYVLKDTKTLAIFGSLEAFAYAIYTVYLTRWLGVVGIAIGYVIFFNLSLLWQLAILNIKTGRNSGLTTIRSFFKTLLAASVGGVLNYLLTFFFSNNIILLLVGGVFGLLIYIGALYVMGSSEFLLIRNLIFKTNLNLRLNS
jgi:putative peptidoglycan lipid II flippase